MLLLSKLYPSFYGCLVTVSKTSRIQSCVCSRRYLTRKPNLDQSYKDRTALNAVEVRKIQIKSFANYITAIVFFISGLGFAAVPLFNAFCSVSSNSQLKQYLSCCSNNKKYCSLRLESSFLIF